MNKSANRRIGPAVAALFNTQSSVEITGCIHAIERGIGVIGSTEMHTDEHTRKAAQHKNESHRSEPIFITNPTPN